jgi:hypothetical protein
MKRIWKVQRLQAPVGRSNPFSFGGGLIDGGFSKEAMKAINDIFSFDYMGAAEFEWGAVPTALHSLAMLSADDKLTTTQLHNGLYVICPKDILLDLGVWIDQMYEDEHTHSLKEGLRLKRSNIQGWLKIEDDRRCDEPFMFFRDEKMFKQTCEILDIK